MRPAPWRARSACAAARPAGVSPEDIDFEAVLGPADSGAHWPDASSDAPPFEEHGDVIFVDGAAIDAEDVRAEGDAAEWDPEADFLEALAAIGEADLAEELFAVVEVAAPIEGMEAREEQQEDDVRAAEVVRPPLPPFEAETSLETD